MKELTIKTDYITLGQFLKWANIVSSGGEVKAFLETATILVDGQKENRRGRKLFPGTVIEVQEQSYRIKAS